MKNPHDRIVDNSPAKPLFMNTSRDERAARRLPDTVMVFQAQYMET
ncbi:hypothetical protein BN135_2050 [Cronobacter muytjensii 530]